MLTAMVCAMVLCAGFGTRLRPLTDGLPKPLVPVGDRPVAAHTLAALATAGVHRIVLNAHHRADDVVAWSQSPTARDAVGGRTELVVVREATILGTAGGVAHAASALGHDDVVVCNGDILAPSLDWRALMDAFMAAGADALWVVSPRPRSQGTVGLNAEGSVVRLRGQRWGEEVAGGDYIGVQVVSPAFRSRFPRTGCLVGDVALPWLACGGRIATMRHEGAWHDIGTPSALLDANLDWLTRKGLENWVDPSACVDPGVTLSRTVVGGGARVVGRGAACECVVMPGAHLAAPAAGHLVAAHGAVVVNRLRTGSLDVS